MSLRQKLLLLFSLTVAAAVAAVAWTVLVRIKHVFEQRDQEITALFVSQFKRAFQHRSVEVAQAVDRLAVSAHTRTMAQDIALTGDVAPFLSEAQAMAQDARLDFLEIVGPDGNIVSSAQAPARFGYAEPAASIASDTAFLKREELPDGTFTLGLFAIRTVKNAERTVKLIGGSRLDQTFLADLPVTPGMTIALYADVAPGTDQMAKTFDANRLISASGSVPGGAMYRPLIESVFKGEQQKSAILYTSARREDSVNVTAIPLKDTAGKVVAVLTIAVSRSGMVAAQQHIRAIAYVVAGGGILLAVAFSLWIAARVSRPIEELARAAGDVADGLWDVRVPERGRDEVTVLARSFNHMTAQLVSQREKLVQTERVAAWRELARRLAHELKNPLFPLQLTVENLVRSRQLSPEEFDEVFQESTSTLSMEIANLKKIIGRFSDFSKMPKPEVETVDARALVERVTALYRSTNASIEFRIEVANEAMPLMVDPELLHRALSNLVLNAMDAMQDGGMVTMTACPAGDNIELRVSDTGEGLTPEECERLFTPYYTTKQHGTGLGLAIVQSVVADHHGTIAVEGKPGGGATFIITLPKAQA